MITNAKYTKDGSIFALIDGQEITIPDDPANRHRIMLTEWEAAGNVIQPYDEPALSPEELRAQMPPLTPRQFRDALIDADIMPDEVTTAISQVQDEKQRAKALNAWEYPTEFTRIDPLIDQIGAMFDLTPEQIDVMWQDALEA